MRPIIYCLLNVLIALAPSAASADDDAATCLTAKGTDAERIAACDRVLTAGSSDTNIISAAHLAKADIFGKARRLNDKFVELDAAVKSDPTSWTALDRRGMGKAFDKQDRPGALADLDSAIKLGPTDYEVYRHRAALKISAETSTYGQVAYRCDSCRT